MYDYQQGDIYQSKWYERAIECVRFECFREVMQSSLSLLLCDWNLGVEEARNYFTNIGLRSYELHTLTNFLRTPKIHLNYGQNL